METSRLKQIVAEGEGTEVEFKRELDSNNPSRICHEVAALASEGGHLIIGVADNWQVVGLDEQTARTIQARLEGWVHSYVSPVPIVEIKLLEIEAFKVCYVHIKKGAAPIYYYRQRPYIRVASSSQVASPKEVIERIFGWEVRSDIKILRDKISEIPHPARATAAAISSQGELATMNYRELIKRLLADFPILAIGPSDS